MCFAHDSSKISICEGVPEEGRSLIKQISATMVLKYILVETQIIGLRCLFSNILEILKKLRRIINA